MRIVELIGLGVSILVVNLNVGSGIGVVKGSVGTSLGSSGGHPL